jgi:hypothetical protein
VNRRGEEPVIDAEFVKYRLEEVGKCLRSLPGGRVRPATLSAQTYGLVSEIVEGSGYTSRLKVVVPYAVDPETELLHAQWRVDNEGSLINPEATD